MEKIIDNNDAKYYLPFIYNKVDIFQGYNGKYSHFKKNTDNKQKCIIDDSYSIDFILPINTPIIASREGTIEKIIDFYEWHNNTFDKNQNKIGTNFIIIKHEDNTYALYSHIKKESSVVKKYQIVKRGDLLAYSGLSGWIGKHPHLHFEPFVKINRFSRISFPIEFEDYKKKI